MKAYKVTVNGNVYEITLEVIDKADIKAAPAPVAAAPAANAPIENRSEIVAAVCAAVAEEEGVDISALRVVSFKKL